MKSFTSRILLLILVLAMLPLPTYALNNTILVSIEEGTGFTVEQNGLRIFPGEDAVFTLTMDSGSSLLDTDYPGETNITQENRTVTLTLRNVNYPVRIHLSISTKYARIAYQPNGGSGEPIEKRYSMTTHPRPNTESGRNMFTREGYTLYSWNTRSDGAGTRVGLGSRIMPENGILTLYAQWAKWTDENCFDWQISEEGTAEITACRSEDDLLVIPAALGGNTVTAIAADAFTGCPASAIILPETLLRIEDRAFADCDLRALTLWDGICAMSDDAFCSCAELTTLYINAYEPPFGYAYRRESMYADKVEMLIRADKQKKLVFYGGCSMWYNLDAAQVEKLFGEEYVIINMGLNGTVSSAVQLQILQNYLSDGDILFHTPELSSKQQLMILNDLDKNDVSLWAGLENNYDLFSLVDLRTISGVFSSFSRYLNSKNSRTDYQSKYTDSAMNTYLDKYGSIPFYRSPTSNTLTDDVLLDPGMISGSQLDTLEAYYHALASAGVKIYVSYACINMDALPEEQKGNVEEMNMRFRERIEQTNCAIPISQLRDYLYGSGDFYDTNYHLCSEAAKDNTAKWLRDLTAQLEKEF